MKIVIIVFILVAVLGIAAYAVDDKSGEDNFLSSTVGSIFDKVGQYTSGEKGIFESENSKPGQDEGYTTDALGNRVPDTTIKSADTSSPNKSL